MEKQSSEKRFALLIDADNVSAKYIKPITDELSNYGTVTIKRIYGDWTLSLHAKWKDALLENSLTPIQQFGYTQGKNATDSAMIIDAMDILYTGSVDGFCIVSSDSDFTRLASRLRESGRMVIGMGEKKTPTPFRRACDVFTTLELLLDDANGKRKGKEAGSGPSIEEVEQAVVRIITDNQNNGKATGLGEVGSRLLKRFPDFDVRSYGTNLLSKLLGKFTSVTIRKNGSDVAVELADDKEPAKEGAKEGAKEASKESAKETEKRAPKESAKDAEHGAVQERADAADAASGERADAVEEGAADRTPDAKAEDDSQEDAAQGSSSRRRRRRRGGTRTSRRRTAAESEEISGASEASEMSQVSETADALESSDATDGSDAPEASETVEVAETPQAAELSGTDPVEPPAPAFDASRAGDAATPESSDAPDPEVPERSARKTRKQPQRKARKQPKREDAVQPTEPVEPARPAQPASDLAEVDATTRRLVAEAGPTGIEMAQLAAQVRAAHRGFKVRDHGHAQFKSYVASLGDIEIERIGKEWFARMGE